MLRQGNHRENILLREGLEKALQMRLQNIFSYFPGEIWLNHDHTHLSSLFAHFHLSSLHNESKCSYNIQFFWRKAKPRNNYINYETLLSNFFHYLGFGG
jgi:hypothetical protein